MNLEFTTNGVNMRIVDSLYIDFYRNESNLKSVNLIGDPIASAVACAIAKAFSKTVNIAKQTLHPDGVTLEISYHIMEG